MNFPRFDNLTSAHATTKVSRTILLADYQQGSPQGRTQTLSSHQSSSVLQKQSPTDTSPYEFLEVNKANSLSHTHEIRSES